MQIELLVDMTHSKRLLPITKTESEDVPAGPSTVDLQVHCDPNHRSMPAARPWICCCLACKHSQASNLSTIKDIGGMLENFVRFLAKLTVYHMHWF